MLYTLSHNFKIEIKVKQEGENIASNIYRISPEGRTSIKDQGTPDPSPRAPDSAPRLLPPRMAAQGHWSDPGPLQRPGARGPGTRGPGVWVRGCGMVCEAVRLPLKGWHSALLGDKAEKSQQAKCERFPNTRQTWTRANPGRTHSFRHS